MIQTLALLVDAYRELNARKMFWISLIISALVMIAFSLLSVDQNGLAILGMKIPAPAPQFIYKTTFSNLVVGLWISIGAMILAIISTASIFPDLLTSGSIDLYLAKPISRLRLFLTKYVGALIFVLLQTGVFAVASFVVFGLRGKQWLPAMFLIIPLGTLLFSYLFAACALFGVLTRSTVATILLTCLFLLLCFVTNSVEQWMYQERVRRAVESREYEREVLSSAQQLEESERHPSGFDVFGLFEQRRRSRHESLKIQAEESKRDARKLDQWYQFIRAFATLIPKTNETTSILDRKLFERGDVAEFHDAIRKGEVGPHRRQRNRTEANISRSSAGTTRPTSGPSEQEFAAEEARREMEQRQAIRMEAAEEADRAARSRSIPWVLGTSIGFEVVVVGLAAWIFCRRDY